MKVALIADGLPRFTPEFLLFMEQLSGFDRADLYFNFWKTSWANDSVEEGRRRIESILHPKFHLERIEIVDQPPCLLPPHKLYHPPPTPENLRWCYQRRIGMGLALKKAFGLINQDYDMYIRFRLDGALLQPLDLRTIDFSKSDLFFQDYGRCGLDDYKISDQFAIGNYNGMKFYCDFIDHFDELFPKIEPDWENNLHTWSYEHVLGLYMKLNNRTQVFGDFKFHINWRGKSKFSEKHAHHPVVPDPTDMPHLFKKN